MRMSLLKLCVCAPVFDSAGNNEETLLFVELGIDNLIRARKSFHSQL